MFFIVEDSLSNLTMQLNFGLKTLQEQHMHLNSIFDRKKIFKFTKINYNFLIKSKGDSHHFDKVNFVDP